MQLPSAAGSPADAASNGSASLNHRSPPALGHLPLAPRFSHDSSPAVLAERLASRNSRREQRAAAREAQAARSRHFSELEAVKAYQRASLATAEPQSHIPAHPSIAASGASTASRASQQAGVPTAEPAFNTPANASAATLGILSSMGSSQQTRIPASGPHGHLTFKPEPSPSAASLGCQQEHNPQAAKVEQGAGPITAEARPHLLSQSLPQPIVTSSRQHGAKRNVPKQDPRFQAQLHPKAGPTGILSAGERRSKSLSPSLSVGSSHASDSIHDVPVLNPKHQPRGHTTSAALQSHHGAQAGSTASALEQGGLRMQEGVLRRTKNSKSNGPAASSPQPACNSPAASKTTGGANKPTLPVDPDSSSQTTTCQSISCEDAASGSDQAASAQGPLEGVQHSRISSTHGPASAQPQATLLGEAGPGSMGSGASGLGAQTPARAQQSVSSSQSAEHQTTFLSEAAPQSLSSPARHARARLGSQDASQQALLSSEAALQLQSGSGSQDAARQHRCKCKAAADGTVPRPCRFCRNVRLMTRLAHQKQLDQRTEAEQKVHTVTLLLNGLRQKHEQQLTEADEAAKCQMSQATDATASDIGTSRAATAAAASASLAASSQEAPSGWLEPHPSMLSNGSALAQAACSSSSPTPLQSPCTATDSLLLNASALPSSANDSQVLAARVETVPAQEAPTSAACSLQPLSAQADAVLPRVATQEASFSEAQQPQDSNGVAPIAASASVQGPQGLSSPSTGTGAAQGTSWGTRSPPASAIPDSLCLSLDPGGSAAWAEARKELDDGLRAMGADAKLADCARKDWERSRLATLSERFFNPSRNAGLPRWAYTSDVNRCLEATKTARFGERTHAEQESWVEHVRLVLRGQRQMPSLKTFNVPGSAQAHHLVVKEIRNQLVRKALERQKLYKDLDKVYNLFLQIMAARELQSA
ncbi:hypothetical protein WJX74_008753 [Apatococcus lobatus]|uniref:Uncharacterized protein n=1 Tax=Apatococcus lobatus TaxID=904363 RepID=A0AAW1QDT3_9CHLO